MSFLFFRYRRKVTYDTNATPISSLVDVLSELERSILYFLQNPTASEGIPPLENVPLIEAPVASQTNVRFFMGQVEGYSHISPPFVLWTLGDTRQAGSQARGQRRPLASRKQARDPVSPRPFKKSLDLVTATIYGAPLEGATPGIDGGADPQAAADRWKRGTARGCEILRWAFWWSLREHWGGNVTFERETWMEVTFNNQTGYAWQSSFRVPMSQMRPQNLTSPTPPIDVTIMRKPDV